MTHRFRSLLVLAAALLAAACGRESPTAVGATLLPTGGIRTFELVLNASDFLVADTAASGFVFPVNAPFEVTAQSFGDTVSAHTLAQFVMPSILISVRDTTTNSTVTDTARFFGANVVLYVDSTAVNPTTAVDLKLYRTAQHWDALTTSWTMAVDSGSTHVPWTQPGGTVGPLVSTATWTPGQDSIVFAVDSATVAAWADTTDATRGALVQMATSGARLRTTSMGYFVKAHGKKFRPDTTVTLSPGLQGLTFIYTPSPHRAPGTLLIGGAPAWRSFLTFNTALPSRTFPCPAAVGSCTFTLHDVTVNYAALLLQPLPGFAFAPEDSVRPTTWVLGSSPSLPLIRTPLGSHISTVSPAFAPATVQAGSPVAIPITSFIATLAGDTATAVGRGLTSNILSIAAVSNSSAAPEPALFGVTAFAGQAGGAAAPKLRLIVTIGAEVQLP